MNAETRRALIVDISARLADKGSWCGATHLQKAIFLLSALTPVKPDLFYLLYHHGPYSFDLTDELDYMTAYQLLESKESPPYGPRLLPTRHGQVLVRQAGAELAAAQAAMQFVVDLVGDKRVAELERIATALFIWQDRHDTMSVDEQAKYMHHLKPHIPVSVAVQAIQEARALEAEARRRFGAAA